MEMTAHEIAKARIEETQTALVCIKSKYLKLERELQQAKWFAYRFMSPFQATRQFALAYEAHYKHAFARHFDRTKNVKAVNWTEFGRPGRTMTQLWIGRQCADRLGMPYRDYLEFFDDFNMRRPRKQLPWPNQIEGNADAKAVWPARLEKFRAERAWSQLVRLEAPQLHIDNYRVYPAQDDFREWVSTVVRTTDRSYRYSLEQFSFRKCFAPSDMWREIIADDLVDELVMGLELDVKDGRVVPDEAPKLSRPSFWPSCFSLNPDPTTIACARCPFKRDCQTVHDRAVLKSTLNTADDLQRKKDRERQARSRKKRKTSRNAD